VYAVNSDLVHYCKLLPPNFPSIEIFFNYNTFETKIQHNCRGESSTHCEIYRDFEIASDVISVLSDISKKYILVQRVRQGSLLPEDLQLTSKPLVSHHLQIARNPYTSLRVLLISFPISSCS